MWHASCPDSGHISGQFECERLLGTRFCEAKEGGHLELDLKVNDEFNPVLFDEEDLWSEPDNYGNHCRPRG